MSHRSLTLGALHKLDALQRLQDTFAEMFSLSMVIIDFEGKPFTKPSLWPNAMENIERRSIWLARLVEDCCRKGEPVSSVSHSTGCFVTAVPLALDGEPLGAWIIDRIRFDASERQVPAGDGWEGREPVMSRTTYSKMVDLLVATNSAVEEIGTMVRDVKACRTELDGVRDQLEVTNAMLRLFIDSSDAAMFVTDYHTGELLMINRVCTELFGGTMEELLGKNCWELAQPGRATICEDCPRESLLDEEGRPAGAVCWVRYSREHGKWLRCTSQALLWNEGRLVIMATIVDISQERRMQDELSRLAFTDHQTGLPNVRRLAQDLEDGFACGENARCGLISLPAGKAARPSDTVNLVCIHLSTLDMVRDAYGRETANETRKAFVAWMREHIPGIAEMYRIEADEYCLVMRQPDEHESMRLAKAIVDRFSKPWNISLADRRTTSFCTVTAAVVHSTRGEVCKRDVVGLVERSLDAARKSKGITVYDDALDLAAREKRRMEASLVACVTESMTGFAVHYQPIVHVTSGKWMAYEALCRWESPEFGPRSPSAFIPAAERLGLIGPIGLWVLENAVRQMKTLGLDRNEDFFLSVNVSPLQLLEADFAEKVEDILRRHDFPARALTLEVTESAEVVFNSYTLSIIDRLRRHGVRMALDDFGTGYSTFTNLKNLPVNFLKTEKTFVEGIEDDKHMQYFYQLMSEIAHATDKRLIAEGVETSWQFKVIRDNGADFIQGFFFSRPLPAAELPEKMVRFAVPEQVFVGIGGQWPARRSSRREGISGSSLPMPLQ